uniref:Uncharacterized protein n=1 Tax=Leersia perrieri TaxID=77586 RepID=A0A0D9WY03_9ORYZ
MDNNTGGSTAKMLGSSGTLGDITDLSAAELKNKRARERYASLSAEKKEEKKTKNREYKQRKKDSFIGIYKSGTDMVVDAGTVQARPQSFVTLTRMVSNDGATCNDNKENTDMPFRCIIQGGTQTNPTNGFGSDKIGRNS